MDGRLARRPWKRSRRRRREARREEDSRAERRAASQARGAADEPSAAERRPGMEARRAPARDARTSGAERPGMDARKNCAEPWKRSGRFRREARREEKPAAERWRSSFSDLRVHRGNTRDRPLRAFAASRRVLLGEAEDDANFVVARRAQLLIALESDDALERA